jgi:outer membrane protein TolC
LCLGQISWPALAQQNNAIAPERPGGSVFTRPYREVSVPAVRPGNSTRYPGLLKAGNLYLSLQDAIALALENNIDLELSRYSPLLAQWRLQRAQAGGFLPGVPSGAAQAGTVASGQGVTGSQTAAGVAGGSFGGRGGGGTNASIAQIGPVTQTLDPIVQHTTTYSHRNTPQPNLVQSQTNVLTSDTFGTNSSVQQGFLSGGSVTLGYRTNYLEENSPTNVLNPSTAVTLSLQFQHNLLRGFGVAVNARTITVARMSLETTDLNFRNQVIGVVTQTVNNYYSLAAAQADVRAKQLALEVAETLRNNVRRQVELGTMAPPELTRSEAQVATSRLALVNAEATVEQQELRLKSLLSRNGIAEPQLAAARIIPTDRLTLPASDDLDSTEAMVAEALAKRPDLGAARANLKANEVSALGTRNNVLPTLVTFGALTTAGLAGTPGQGPSRPDPYFVGGTGTATAQAFRRNFPTDRIGVFYQGALRNRAAQADYAIDQLQNRQNEISTEKRMTQVQVDVLNGVVALRQARARYEAALKNVELQEALLRSEQRKFELGAATPAEVIQQQRDLATAQSNQLSALVSYTNAKVALERTLGRTLETYGVSIDEARTGTVARTSVSPAP